MIFSEQTFGDWFGIVKEHLRRRGHETLADEADPDAWKPYWVECYNPGAAVRAALSEDRT